MARAFPSTLNNYDFKDPGEERVFAILKALPEDCRAVKLEWQQSLSANISYNKVYRAAVAGGPYTVAATLQRTQAYRAQPTVSGVKVEAGTG